MVIQLGEYTKTTEMYTLKGLILWYSNYISILKIVEKTVTYSDSYNGRYKKSMMIIIKMTIWGKTKKKKSIQT